MKTLVVGLTFFISASITSASDLSILSVKDGNTILAKNAEGQKIVLSLSGVDCPERKQRNFQFTKNVLEEAINSGTAKISLDSPIKYKRAKITVSIDGENLNKGLVSSGTCWADRNHTKYPEYAALEKKARYTSKGFWANNLHLVAPWKFRNYL